MFSVFMFVAGITSHQITHSTVACWADLVIKQQLKSKFLSPPQLGTPVFRLHLCIVTGSRVTSVLQSCGMLWRPTAGGDNIHYTVRVCRGVVPGHHPHPLSLILIHGSNLILFNKPHSHSQYTIVACHHLQREELGAGQCSGLSAVAGCPGLCAVSLNITF